MNAHAYDSIDRRPKVPPERERVIPVIVPLRNALTPREHAHCCKSVRHIALTPAIERAGEITRSPPRQLPDNHVAVSEDACDAREQRIERGIQHYPNGVGCVESSEVGLRGDRSAQMLRSRRDDGGVEIVFRDRSVAQPRPQFVSRVHRSSPKRSSAS